MKRYKFYLPVVLSFLLVISCMMPANVYALNPSGDTDQTESMTSALTFEEDSYVVNENNGYAEIKVNRNNGTDGEVSVDYSTSDSTATAGADYASTSGALIFKDGEVAKTFTIPILDDVNIEGDEVVKLSLSNPQGGADLGEQSTAILTIKDNDSDNEETCIVEGCETLQSEGGFTSGTAISGGGLRYHIDSPEQLAHISHHMDLDYIQTNDINLDPGEVGETWTPIGGFEDPEPFTGSYDGDGKQITNMYISEEDDTLGDITAGLFSIATEETHFEDINLSTKNISIVRYLSEGSEPSSNYGNIYIGGIVGEHHSDWTIDNCNVTIGAIDVTNYVGDILVGGVAGINSGSITDCSVAFVDDVILDAGYGYILFGGITAANRYDGAIDNSKSLISNDIEISCNEDFYYGGIVGDNAGDISNCNSESDCFLAANLYGYKDDPTGDSFIGGLCGYTSGIIENSSQEGLIEADINRKTNEPADLKDLITEKSVTSKSEMNLKSMDEDQNNIYVGGIAGFVVPNDNYEFTVPEDNPASIFNTDHTGGINVKSDNNSYVNIDNLYVGGIAGYVNSDTTNMLLIENCQNDGSIRSENLSGSAFSGGIIGYIYQDIPENELTETYEYAEVRILNCANINTDAEIEAYGTNEMAIAGGVVGASRFTPKSQPTIENTYNRSDVYSKLTYYDKTETDTENSMKGYQCEGAASGGIIGASGGVSILSSYSSADLITSSAIIPEDSISIMEMPVLPITGYAGGIAGLIYGTEFNQNYYEANENVVNGIGGAVVGYEILPGTDPNVISASAAQLKSKSFFGDAWKWYTSGGTDPQYYNSIDPWRMIAADTYPVLRGKLYTPSTPSSSGGGGGGSSIETPPPVAGLPDGTLIDRMAGYIALSKPSKINEVKSEIELEYDTALQKNNSANSPRIYYWNADKKNWVALATYEVSNGKVKAVNDGKYKGWFVVFGVVQPEFSDAQGNWAEKVINRMNGLGMVEGYPSEDGSMQRIVLPDQNVSHAEFTMLISRILNLDIDDPKLPLISKEESRNLLTASFTDGDEIPSWVLQAAGTLNKKNLLPENDSEFQASTSITRIEAAVMISKALSLLTECKDADLSKFTDSNEIPDWAKGELVEGVMIGYLDGTFRPNDKLTRAEALTMLHRLFVEGLGW